MISLEDQIRCVRREVALRRTIYAKWGGGELAPDHARELATMRAVLATLEGLRRSQDDGK